MLTEIKVNKGQFQKGHIPWHSGKRGLLKELNLI